MLSWIGVSCKVGEVGIFVDVFFNGYKVKLLIDIGVIFSIILLDIFNIVVERVN